MRRDSVEPLVTGTFTPAPPPPPPEGTVTLTMKRSVAVTLKALLLDVEVNNNPDVSAHVTALASALYEAKVPSYGNDVAALLGSFTIRGGRII